MEHAWFIILVSVFAGVVSVDRAAAGQFLLSRPVVAAALLGFLCGYPAEGLVTGLVFELLFLSSLPVGSYIPDQALFPALLAVLMLKVGGAADALPAAVILALPSLFLDRLADRMWRRSNEKAFHRAKAYIRMGKVNLAEGLHRLAILRAALFHMTAFLISCVVLIPVFRLATERVDSLHVPFMAAGIVPFIVGLAALTASHVRGKGWIGFAVGLVFGAVVGLT